MPRFPVLLTALVLLALPARAQSETIVSAGDLKVTLTPTKPDRNAWYQAGRLTFERPGGPARSVETTRLRGAARPTLSPDRRWLSVVNTGGGFAQLWDVHTAERVFSFLAHDKVSYFAQVADFSPDSSRVVFYAYPHELSLWNTATGQRVKQLGDVRPMWYLADGAVQFSPAGQAFVVTGSGAGAHLFDTRSGALLQTFDRPWSLGGRFWRGSIGAVFAPDGKTLAVLYAGGEARLYRTGAAQALARATWAAEGWRGSSRSWSGALRLEGRTLSGRTPNGWTFAATF